MFSNSLAQVYLWILIPQALPLFAMLNQFSPPSVHLFRGIYIVMLFSAVVLARQNL